MWERCGNYCCCAAVPRRCCPCSPFVSRGVRHQRTAPSFHWGGRERKRRGVTKGLGTAVPAHCLTERHASEQRCFVISVPVGLYAVNIFFSGAVRVSLVQSTDVLWME